MRVVLLDSGPLGLVSNPRKTLQAEQCNKWLESILLSDIRILIPEIADYEVRRELLRANKVRGIQRLDFLKNEIGYLPITTQANEYYQFNQSIEPRWLCFSSIRCFEAYQAEKQKTPQRG